jgi:hypothetical protein
MARSHVAMDAGGEERPPVGTATPLGDAGDGVATPVHDDAAMQVPAASAGVPAQTHQKGKRQGSKLQIVQRRSRGLPGVCAVRIGWSR